MELNTAIDSVGYRSKGPDDTRTMCAIKFSQPLLQLMGDPERVQVVLGTPLYQHGSDDAQHYAGQFRWLMYIDPHPAGYKLNFKPGSKQGEIAIAWALLKAKAPTPEGKGRLPCWMRGAQLRIDISTWSDETPAQETLFASWGTVLLP